MRCNSGTEIGRVLARGARDEPAERNRLGFLLGGADLEPRGLAPGAILVVRSLTDPLPGCLGDGRSALRLNLEWEQAARERLEALRLTAARPRRGQAPPEVPAVIFADEAELLACLALDLARGEAASRWWWQVARRSFPPTLSKLLCERASLVPATFEILENWGWAQVVAQALPREALGAVFISMARAFDAPALASLAPRSVAASTDGPTPSGSTESAPAASSPRQSQAARDAGGSQCSEAISRGTFAGAQVPDAPLLLVHVALTLYRRPALARSPAFAQELRRWLSTPPQTPEAVRPALAVVGRNHDDGQGASLIRSPHLAESVARSRPAGSPSAPASASARRSRPGASGEDQPSTPGNQARAEAAEFTGPGKPESGEQIAFPCTPSPLAAPEPLSPGALEATVTVAPAGSRLGRPTRVPEAAVLEPAGIVTDLGGVFFLIGALDRLGPPVSANPWALLEAFAQALVPERAFDADPLWAVLRALDQRPADAPPPLEATGWVAEQLPRMGDRLRAIAADSPPTAPCPREFPWAGLLVHRARVLLTRARVDVLFRLDQIRLPIRRAGLDRDPGWRPAFGRIIRFHFD